jgi:hypothetical protein
MVNTKWTETVYIPEYIRDRADFDNFPSGYKGTIKCTYVNAETIELSRHKTLNVGFSLKLTCKWPNGVCGKFSTDFIDWRCIHSLVGIFDPACELLPPWTKELYLCTVAPLLFLLSDLLPPPPFPTVQNIQTVCDCGGRGLFKCTVDHIPWELVAQLPEST